MFSRCFRGIPLLLACLYGGVLPSRQTGIVTTDNGTPIPYATVIHKSGNSWVLTDENGFFQSVLPVSPGDSLTITRYGYQTVVIATQPAQTLRIVLRPDPIRLPDITVETETSALLGDRAMPFPTTGEPSRIVIYQQIPGLILRNYGGSAGVATVGLDGGPATHTQIRFDGIDLTSAQNGETDLSQLPISFLKTASVSRTPGVYNGSGAIDGVVQIHPWSNQTNFSITGGSYGYRSVTGNLRWSGRKSNLDIMIGKQTDRGDYPVIWKQQTLKRRNNNFDQDFWSFRYQNLFTNRSFLKIIALDSRQERGVAGLVWSPTSDARRNDRLQISALTVGRLLRRGYLKLQVNRRNSREHFIYPGIAVNSRHIVNTETINMIYHWRDDRRFNLLSRLEWKQDRLNSTNAGKRRRISRSLAIRLRYTPLTSVAFTPTLRWDDSRNLYQKLTYDFKTEFTVVRQLGLSYSFGTAFRYPTFNDLFWQPGGNPDLKAETAQHQVLELKLKISPTFSLSGAVRHISSRNLIQWVPHGDLWQPENVARSEKLSYSIRGNLQLPGLPLEVRGHFTKLRTEDRKTRKPLRYAPEYLSALSIAFPLSRSDIGVQIHHTGARVAMYSWPGDVILPGFTFLSTYLELRRKYFTINFTVENLFNNHYMTIYGYPEPGRNYRLTLTLQQPEKP